MSRQIFLLKWVALLVFICPTSQVAAQTSEPSLAYGSLEGNFGTYRGLSMQLHFVSPKRYSVAFGFTSSKRDTWIPSDYRDGFSMPLDHDGMGFRNDPIDFHSHVHLLAGRVIQLTKSGLFRLNVMSGLGLGIFRDVENWRPYIPEDGFLANPYAILASNYNYDFKYRLSPSLMVQPKLEMVIHENFGLSLSPLAQFNFYRSYYGFTVGVIAGRLR